MSKYGVIISSAINVVVDTIYSPQQRLEQTLKTIESVRERIPNSIIVLADSSIPGLSDEMKKTLSDRVDYLLDFSKDTLLNQIRSIQHKDTLQNLSELIVLNKAFAIIKSKSWFDNCDRIFKMSGRYWLNDKFNIELYNLPTVKNKYVLTKRMLSQFPKEVTHQTLQHMLRVYSFDGSLLDDFMTRLKTMTTHLQERVNQGGYTDVEHLFCKFIPRYMIYEIARSGVAGNISKNGVMIEN
jgi:hypothetical protein